MGMARRASTSKDVGLFSNILMFTLFIQFSHHHYRQAQRQSIKSGHDMDLNSNTFWTNPEGVKCARKVKFYSHCQPHVPIWVKVTCNDLSHQNRTGMSTE